jgi:hypothetical protein
VILVHIDVSSTLGHGRSLEWQSCDIALFLLEHIIRFEASKNSIILRLCCAENTRVRLSRMIISDRVMGGAKPSFSAAIPLSRDMDLNHSAVGDHYWIITCQSDPAQKSFVKNRGFWNFTRTSPDLLLTALDGDLLLQGTINMDNNYPTGIVGRKA